MKGVRLLIEKRAVPRDTCFGLWIDLWIVDSSRAAGPGFGLVGHGLCILKS